jgi:hypothetical protein
MKYNFFHRRHNSRASSVDRREIFEKYVQEGSEHSSKILPYCNDDPELNGHDNGFKYPTNDNSSLKTNFKKESPENHETNEHQSKNQISNSLNILTSDDGKITTNIDKSYTCQTHSVTNTSHNASKPAQVRDT